MSEVRESLLAWLRRKSGPDGGRLKARGIAQRTIRDLDTDLMSVIEAFSELRQAGLVSFTPDTMGVPYTGYLMVVAETIETPQAAQAWQAALAMEGVDNELALALMPCHGTFEGLDLFDMRLVVRGLLRVREMAGASGENDFGFSVSAREILGSSKVLGRLPIAALKLLGVEHLASTPRYVVVAGPAAPIGVLLIENTTSFELAVRAGLDSELVLVAAYGYGLNMLSDSSAGLALLDSVRNGRCEVLSRSGQGHSLQALLAHPRLFFWGDLDREGLRIASALKQKLPSLALSALYAPMRDLVHQRESSHPYVGMSGKALQAPWTPVGDALLDGLAAHCESRAVDQEALDIVQHRALATHSLSDAITDTAVGSGPAAGNVQERNASST